MKIYFHDINDFIICCGYKGYVIKEYFANYFLHLSVTLICNTTRWKYTSAMRTVACYLGGHGSDTMTGGRLKRVAPYLRGEDAFCFNGDGVSDIKYHKL